MSPNRDKTVSPRSANKLTRELSLTKRSMEKLEAEYKTEIWELENELQRKCSTIEFLTKQVKHYQDQQGQNVPKLPLEAIESSPSPRNDDLPTERQVLNEELKKLQNYLGNLLKKFNANEAAMYAFKQDLWQRENELKSKQLMIRSLNSQINRHTEQKIEWERCNDDLKTQINQLQSEIMKLEEKLRDISTENQLLDGELRDSQHEIDNLSLVRHGKAMAVDIRRSLCLYISLMISDDFYWLRWRQRFARVSCGIFDVIVFIDSIVTTTCRCDMLTISLLSKHRRRNI